MMTIIPVQGTTQVKIAPLKGSNDSVLWLIPEHVGPWGEDFPRVDKGFITHYQEQNPWEKTKDNGLKKICGKEGVGSCQIYVRAEQDFVEAKLVIQNESKQVWKSAIVMICCHFKEASGFFNGNIEQTMERSWISIAGRKTRIIDTDRKKSLDQCMPIYFHKKLNEIPQIEKHDLRYGWSLSSHRPDKPLIAMESIDKKWVLGTCFKEGNRILFNTKVPHHGCIHSDPIIEKLEPGAIIEIKGRIYFLKGTIEEMFERFEQDYGSL